MKIKINNKNINNKTKNEETPVRKRRRKLNDEQIQAQIDKSIEIVNEYNKINEETRKRRAGKSVNEYREDVNKLINISDIGILLSYREGLPRNIMEFMACGRKVIATDIRGCRDLVCNDSIGALVKVGDYKETAKAIEKYYILNDKSFEVSKEIKKYDIESINSELLKIYEYVQLDINYEKGLSSYVSNR